MDNAHDIGNRMPKNNHSAMTLRDWVAVVVLVLVAVAATHTYDQHTAEGAARTAATVVYKNGLLSCQGTNPTRKAQHEYFVAIATGRTAEAKADDRPEAKAVDEGIAQVAYHTAKTYTDRYGSRADGTLICSKTVKHP